MNRLFMNAYIHTLQTIDEIAKAVLVRDGKIEDLFYENRTLPIADEIIDLKEMHVYPGFIDSHTHSFEGGLYSQAVNLYDSHSLSDIFERLSEYYHHAKQNGINQIYAFRFDENKIKEKRFPTIDELDKVVPDMLMLLRRIDGHSCISNTFTYHAFYQSCNKQRLSPYIQRGNTNDRLVHWMHNNCSEELILSAYMKASQIAAQNGHTTIHTMIGDARNSLMHYQLVKNNLHIFDVEYVLYPQSFNLKNALELGAKRIGGCILADGSLGSYTAALRKPYQNKPNVMGILYQTDNFWKKWISEATKSGLQVAVHCIGDRAIKQINDVYYEIYHGQPHDLRHELIHCELTPDELVDDIVKANSVPVMQPAFDLYWGGKNGFYQKALGKERKNQMNRFKTFIDKGVMITGGSDWYITELDALQGIKAAINHNNPNERLTPYQALKLYTTNSAWLSHDEHRIGILKRGFDADFVCLNQDLLATVDWDDLRVLATYKKGKCIYSICQ